ncbi:MAG: S8 family serine peptidase, partial [Muribaculaceae bacterium]|nr:S8 family serine peptidase [Muribaculaceae bacterium]
MKKFSILALFALGAMTVAAQNKIDLPGCDIVSATRDLNLTGSRSALELKTVPLDVALDKQYTVIVTSDLSADQLAENGAEVIAVRGDMAIVRVTATAMEQLAAMPQVSGISLGVGAKANMDMARAVTEVNALHDGKVLGGTKYTGAGVIAGIMDEGLDPNHMNFLNADGSLRTSRVWTVRGANGFITEYLTPERIASFTTDDRKKTHGTHVLGIMAGSYNGPAKYIFVNSRGATQLRQQTVPTSKIPYYGIATEAELAVACGEFLNNNVEIGAEKVAEYAKSVGKPAVVNLSIGNTYGPHDGTDANSRWLERIGEDVILCIAAGNDGDEPVSIRKSFTASNRSLRTFVGRVATTGIVDFWGADDSVYDVTFIAYNIETGETLYSYKLDRNLKGE